MSFDGPFVNFGLTFGSLLASLGSLSGAAVITTCVCHFFGLFGNFGKPVGNRGGPQGKLHTLNNSKAYRKWPPSLIRETSKSSPIQNGRNAIPIKNPTHTRIGLFRKLQKSIPEAIPNWIQNDSQRVPDPKTQLENYQLWVPKPFQVRAETISKTTAMNSHAQCIYIYIHIYIYI
jgi:hypothetical protein